MQYSSERTVLLVSADIVKIATANKKRRSMIISNPSQSSTDIVYVILSPQPAGNYGQGTPLYPEESIFLEASNDGTCEWQGDVYAGAVNIQNIVVQEISNE